MQTAHGDHAVRLGRVLATQSTWGAANRIPGGRQTSVAMGRATWQELASKRERTSFQRAGRRATVPQTATWSERVDGGKEAASREIQRIDSRGGLDGDNQGGVEVMWL
jgi:hypothetical protein